MPVSELSKTRKALADADRRDKQNQLAIRAHRMRRSGKTWWDIAEELGVTEEVASTLVSERLRRAAELVDEGARRELLTLEVERLDLLQQAVWDDAVGGDTKAVETALKIIDKRAKLLGLENSTGQQVSNNTIIVQGDTKGYIEALRQAARRPELEN